MIEVAFRQLLANADAVKAIVADRVLFGTRPQDERRPTLVLSLVSAVPGFNLDGVAGYVTGRMQINCLAPSYPQAKELAAAVRSVIDGYSGTTDDTEVGFIETESVRDLPAVALQGSGQPATYGVAIDALFLHKE